MITGIMIIVSKYNFLEGRERVTMNIVPVIKS